MSRQKPRKDQLTEVIRFRVTPEVYARLESEAQKLASFGIRSVADYVRVLALRALEQASERESATAGQRTERNK